jgi:molybdopterin/thiamine biosynthesis adenylyltransferase
MVAPHTARFTVTEYLALEAVGTCTLANGVVLELSKLYRLV